jgi:hypothetical protein
MIEDHRHLFQPVRDILGLASQSGPLWAAGGELSNSTVLPHPVFVGQTTLTTGDPHRLLLTILPPSLP